MMEAKDEVDACMCDTPAGLYVDSINLGVLVICLHRSIIGAVDISPDGYPPSFKVETMCQVEPWQPSSTC